MIKRFNTEAEADAWIEKMKNDEPGFGVLDYRRKDGKIIVKFDISSWDDLYPERPIEL